MQLSFSFFLGAVLLGIGLAMDAFSVSIAAALSEPDMKHGKRAGLPLTFACFQALMPLLGWILVKTAVQQFAFLEKCIPYLALALLGWIGVKTIIDSLREKEQVQESRGSGILTVLVQGLATSIDALSVGLTTEPYSLLQVLLSSFIIGCVTFVICRLGIALGARFGKVFKKAEIIGGVILIAIGLEIFIKGVFF